MLIEEEIRAEKQRLAEIKAVKQKNELTISKTFNLNNVNVKTVEGIIYILELLYREMLNEGHKYDLLRLGAVKLSADLFKEILKDMPEEVKLDDYLSDKFKSEVDNND